MLNSDVYIMVANRCPAYNAIFNTGPEGKNLISCITCENFKDGGCILNYIDIVVLNNMANEWNNNR